MSAMARPKDRPPGLPEGAETEFADRLSYGGYLALDELLACQRPVSAQHDEMLFVIIHQATELWLKLVLHELEGALTQIRADDLQPAFKMLARVSRVQSQLIQSWDVLSTLTPSEYMSFRGGLGSASGFQSHQYRLIEFRLGNKNPAMLEPHRHDPVIHKRLAAALAEPSLYDEAIRLLAARGLAIDPAVLERDWRTRHTPHPSVHAAWLTIYRDTAAHWDLYELAEKLVDVEDWFQQWRFRHATTVERVIGHKRGTGGTAGVGYLKGALDMRFFPELWDIRTAL